MPTRSELRETYSTQDTEMLLELRSRDTLIPDAYPVLDEILKERGLDPAIATKAFQDAEMEVAREHKKELGPYIERCWRGLYLAFACSVCALAIGIVLSYSASSDLGALAVVVALFAMLTFYVFLGKLASALGRSVLGWVAIALFVPLVGKILALGYMHSFVSQTRGGCRPSHNAVDHNEVDRKCSVG